MPTVEGAGVPLRYVERGEGVAVLLIHGIAADAEALAGVADRLADAARVIAYDRRGYGGSGAPEPYGGTTVEEQAEDAATLLRALGAAPAVVAGDGFGALVALDLLKRHAALVRAAVLADPPLFMFVPEATEALAGERREIEDAVRAHGPEAGVRAWLKGRAGEAQLARACAAHRAFFADYAGLASWPVTRRELRSLAAPAVVLTGPASPPHVVAAADRLAALLPSARRAAGEDVAAAVRSLLGAE
ncbi:MAG TPA: alpha/beta hydrolase [Solirubrobacteraceae bacterium]|nr:alpha/beta hydrolase [Solirubrobacteraceae bacterium]